MTELNFKNLARYDKGIIRGEAEITQEGFIKARAIVTRCGVFLYKNADGTVRKELRHPDDVLITESLDSMKMVPVVDGHPAERLVSAENAKRLSVGYTGELVEKDLPYIIANMVITDKDIVDEIKTKRKNELSLGYTVDLIPDSGTYFGEPYEFRQTNIRYNHLAIVDQARAGPEARIALDGQDAEEILKEESYVAVKEVKTKKIKIDNQEYSVEEGAANQFEELMKKHTDLMGQHMALKDEHEKLTAERDSLRDKDVHNPEDVHHPMENDEIGSQGKEINDPTDTYGMQSHVKDYEKPTNMENHPVTNPTNEHYPKDLAHVAKVDAAEVNLRVKQRVKLEKLSERYLSKEVVSRMDRYSDLDLKKNLIQTIQPNAQLHGKSDVYINARFDAVCEELPREKVIANSVKINSDEEEFKDKADASESRKAMIRRQKIAYKGSK